MDGSEIEKSSQHILDLLSRELERQTKVYPDVCVAALQLDGSTRVASVG